MAIWQVLRTLWWFAAPQRKLVYWSLVAMAGMQVLGQLMAYLFKVLVEAMDYSDKGAAYSTALVVIGLFVIQQALHRALDYKADQWVFELLMGLRRDLVTRAHRLLLSLSLSYHETNQTGVVMEKVERGVEKAATLLDRWVWHGASTFFLFLFSVATLAGVSVHIASVVLALFPVLVYIGMRYCEIARPHREAHHTYSEAAKNLALQNVQNVMTVQTFGQERYREQQLGDVWQRLIECARQELNLGLRSVLIRGSVATTLLAFVIWSSASAILSGSLTKGDFVFVLLVSRTIIDHMWGFCQLIDETGRDSTAIERLKTLLELRPTVVEPACPKAIIDPVGHIVCHEITVRYEGQLTPALSDFSVDVPPGTVVALVGKSGSGKSTAARSMLRWLDPIQGSIRIDGVDIRDLALSFRRDFFGCVLQPPQLFDDTVASNISFGRPDASLGDIVRAAEIAQAHEFVTKLPDGYQTRIGENGIRLSSGQQQRIIFARAVLSNPRILVLDEATSNLDTEAEAYIQAALPQILEGRTAVIIAHRLSTIRHADLILVLDEGRIVERGTHQSLMAHNGIYHRLQHLQAVGAIDKGAL